MTDRITRLARSATVATATVATASLAHVLAGGGIPGPLGIAAPLLFAVLGNLVIVRERSGVSVFAAITVGQLLFHLLVPLGSAGGSIATSGHHGTAVITASGGAPLLPLAVMTVSHLAAAICSYLLVALAERAALSGPRPFTPAVMPSA